MKQPLVAERERRIRELMDQAGMTRQDAEFATAVDLGEIPGDVIEVDDPGVVGTKRNESSGRR